MKATVAWQPTAPGERLLVLDVLRGFALLGILLMNIEGMAGPLLASFTGLGPQWHGTDRWADAVVYVLVQGKFYTLFSLLFGMGFAVMAQRAAVARRPFTQTWLRRSAGLLVIGLLHAVLVWSGDILLSYALLALLLLPFEQAPRRWLPWLALAAYLLPSALDGVFGAIGSSMQAHPAAAGEWGEAMARQGAQMQAMLEAQRHAYGSGSFADATWQRWRDTRMSLGYLPLIGGQIFGMFLLGAWFVRSGIMAAPELHSRLFARLRWLAWPSGLAAMLASFAIEPTADWGRVDLRTASASGLAALAGLLMSLGYLGWIVRGMQSRHWRQWLEALAPAGRMALSNYLMQSLLCTWIFFGYGFGYFDRLPRAWQVPFALALFAGQVAFSHFWLRHFRFGPVEWLWRGLTYLRWPPFRRAAISR